MTAPTGAELPANPLVVFDLSGKVAVVTGAAGGVGRGCAEILAAAGAYVVAADVKDATGTTEIVKARGGDGEAVLLDVTDKGAFDALAADVAVRKGSLDVLVNNAGIQRRSTALEFPAEDIDAIVEVNFKGVLFGCQAAGRIMLEQGSGSIVNIASEAIDRPAPQILAYAGTKAAVRQMTRNFAIEWGSAGVRVNTVAPGWMLTPLTKQLNVADVEGAATDEEALRTRMESRAAMSPMGRTGTPADVAYAVLYLASDASSWVTGQAIRLNGGASMPW
ncbi:SDR family NAD(P)-dependent oxidoreductase [Streptomyces flaveolus]|uniref:SDR family NAD(P)-dependent oxidoreductase n=1 Tax=Streptomyces flaveolus TaxID=67297 RepID=UPI00382898FB